MRYSLAGYILTVTNISEEFGLSEISIGGEGSYLGGIDVSRDDTNVTTDADATGSWTHSFNLSMKGKVTVELNQLAPKITQLRNIFNVYYKSNIKTGLTLTITDSDQQTVHTCNDCYIEKPADASYGRTAGNQRWVFTCGQILDQ